MIGSGDLAQTLMHHGLVDQYRLIINPIVVGSGKRLFREGAERSALRLVESTISSTGQMIATYETVEA